MSGRPFRVPESVPSTNAYSPLPQISGAARAASSTFLQTIQHESTRGTRLTRLVSADGCCSVNFESAPAALRQVTSA